MTLDKELSRRFKAYLNFYPYWVEVIRDDEREERHETRHSSKEDSLWDELPHEEGRGLLREEVVPANDKMKDDPLRTLVNASTENVRDWIERYCRQSDARRMISRFEMGKTEEEIARDEGVSQQAISLTLIRGCRDLRKGFEADRPEILKDLCL